MIYNEKTITEKRKALYSHGTRIRTTILIVILYVLFFLFLIAAVSASGFLYGAFRGILDDIPVDYTLQPLYSVTFIYDNDGRDVQHLSVQSSNRILVDQTPDDLKHAFIAIEDERFYEHNGIDMKGIVRALVNDLKNGSASQGASTITQQLIKNNMFDVGGERHFVSRLHRKIKEQCMAIAVERKIDKETILRDYLNTINLGKGNLGVESASLYYFGKHSDKLNLSESAVLAGITKNPSSLNPVDYPEDNNDRRELVLRKMYDLGYISNEEYQSALEDDVYTRIASYTNKQKEHTVYSYFTDALITQIVEDLQKTNKYTQSQAYNLIYKGGLRIHSTQDSDLQAIADHVINDNKNYPVDTKYSLEYNLKVTRADQSEVIYTESDVRDYFRKKKKDKDYSIVYPSVAKLKKAVKKYKKAVLKEGDTITEETLHYVMEPQLSYSLIDQKTGQVKVLVGGRGRKNDDLALNRATSVARQPGSTFKILAAYAPAMDSGRITLATTMEDAPYRYENGTKVNNFIKNRYEGMMTIRDAIADSNNILAVKTLTEITPQTGFDYLQKLGFTTLVSNRTGANGGLESDINQSLSLGGITDGVTNLELTAAYAAIANKGRYNRPILYTTVTDAKGNVILENKRQSEKVMEETTAWLLTSAMEDVVSRGTGVEAQLDSSMAVAGKTGTTSNNYDYWFCGYTPYYTAAIWTGYDYNTSFENEKDYHKVIWKKIMDKINQTKKLKAKDFPACDGIEKRAICIKSGKRPIDGVCSDDPQHSMVRTEYFAKGTAPRDKCDMHEAVVICADSHRTAGKYCPRKYRRIYRIRKDKASKKTADAQYFLNFNPKKDFCKVHTREWKIKHDEEVRKKKEEEKRKKEDQQNRERREKVKGLLERLFHP